MSESDERQRISAVAMASPMPQLRPFRWFALYTVPRHEKTVAAELGARQIENFLPLYRTARRWRNRCQVTLELPLFPGYVFVHLGPQSRGRVLSVPGVLSLVGSAREGWPMPDAEIEALRAGLHLLKVEPYPYLVIGERARIKTGPLAGLEGVLVRKKSSLRVVLSIEQIMQSVAVEVDADNLEGVKSHPPRTAAL